MKKTIMSATMAATMLLGSATSAFAVPTHYIVDQKAYTVVDLTNDGYMTDYQNAAKGKKVYLADKDANKTIVLADLAGREYEDAIKNGKNVANEITEEVKVVGADLKPGASLEVPGQEEAGELKVEEVSAITETVKAKAGQRLGFTINNGKTVSIAELKLEGYEVKFNSTLDKAVHTDLEDNGIVAGETSGLTTFEYKVVITHEDDADFKVESEWKEVKVADDEEIVAVEVELHNDATPSKKVDFITVGEATNVFKVTNLIQADGEKEDTTTGYTVKKATTSNLSVATWNGTNVIAEGPGTATFTIEVQEIADSTNKFEVTIKVVVKEAQKVKSAVVKDATIKYENSNEEDIVILVKDQNGDVMKGDLTAAGQVIRVEVNGVDATVAGDDEGGEITATTAVFEDLEPGKQTVKVFYTAKSGATEVKIGEFKVDVVDLENVEFKYELSLQEDSKEKLNLLAANTDKVILDIKSTQNGVVKANTLKDFAANTDGDFVRVLDAKADIDSFTDSDEEITIKKNADTKVGKVVVQIVRVKGDKVTVLASYSVDVVNTTPQVETMTHISNAPKFATTPDAEAIAALVANGNMLVTMSEGDFDEAMIASVSYVASNKALKIVMEEVNGGKTFFIENVTVTTP